MQDQYRFKTEKELINEFGYNWRDNIPCKWCSDMDHLFGTIFPLKIVPTKDTSVILKDFNKRTWAISLDMLIKVQGPVLESVRDYSIIKYEKIHLRQ